MGKILDSSPQDSENLRRFTRHLLDDIHVLEQMLEQGRFESDIGRIGAEQELVLIGPDWKPASKAVELLKELEPHGFTPELALFNLEYPVGPLTFEGDCLRRLEEMLKEKLALAKNVAEKHNVILGLFGILPSIRKADLTLDNMTKSARYERLNEVLTRMRGREYEVHISGPDELNTTHDNLMLEAVNTSFQVHFQVPPEEFQQRYNIAQAVLGPVLAASANSPLVGRYRLWHETRVALFQQSLDTRDGPVERELTPRVSFGTKWVDSSVLELFQEDIAKFKILFSVEDVENPHEAIAEGRAPRLDALRLHAGTVYRWNRAVYGISDGAPHIRIENRALPAGPTIIDEVSNAALWFGAMAGLAREVKDIREAMAFEDARDNFSNAAIHGLESQMTWLGGERLSARELVLNHLIPLARRGLASRGVDDEDIKRYLGVIEERTETGQTGSVWQLQSLSEMTGHGTRWEKIHALVAATLARQAEERPVHTWEKARLEEAGGWRSNYLRVEQVMTSEIFTVHPDDSLDLVANLMVWHRIRHVLVEDERHRLVGLVTYRHLLKLYGKNLDKGDRPMAVWEVMNSKPQTIAPDTSSLEAIQIMRERRISCLPVVKDDRLVGVITEDDFMNMAGSLLSDHVESGSPEAKHDEEL